MLEDEESLWDYVEDISAEDTDALFFSDTQSYRRTSLDSNLSSSSSTLFSETDQPISLKRIREDSPESQDFEPAKRLRLSEDSECPVRDAVVIAYNDSVNTLFTQHDIGIGSQFVLARLATLGKATYDDIMSWDVKHLEGSHQGRTSKIPTLVDPDDAALPELVYGDEYSATAPWEELDTETTVLASDPFGGIGNNANHPGWHGGKVQFRAILRLQPNGKQFRMELEEPHLGASCRVTRRFGSWCFLRTRIPNEILHGQGKLLTAYFQRPFVLWDRVYEALYAKENSVFLFRTNKVIQNGRVTILPESDTEKSLWGYLEWMNPLEPRKDQKLSKWAARFALCLSTSIPGPRIAQEDIMEIQDLFGQTDDGQATESEMTDGCGLSNLVLHILIRQQLQLGSVPTAVQFRLAGAKGMLTWVRPDELLEKPTVWLRDSQLKVQHDFTQKLDPAHLTVDLLRLSSLRTGVRLSVEVIINLHHNKVPESVFIGLLKESMRSAIEPLFKWEGKDWEYDLWCAVENAEGVLRARRAREAAGEARINGHRDRDDDDVPDAEDEIGAVKEMKSVAWWTDPISGCPSSLAETCMVLLDAGFTPQTSPILRAKLKDVVRNNIKRILEKCRFEVAMSCGAFVVPDPYGVLEENEIQVRSSRHNLVQPDGSDSAALNDIDVLMTRNPCKVSTDVRKLRAVTRPELTDWVDVIVCSTKGSRRLLDYLAGGDYDGDKCQVIWDPRIVDPFSPNPAETSHADVPAGLQQDFLVDQTKVSEFCAVNARATKEDKLALLKPYVLGALRDASVVSLYSKLHDNATYSQGYGDLNTVRLAYKFCKVLDGGKAGETIKDSVRQADERSFGHSSGPHWKYTSKNFKDSRSRSHAGTSVLSPAVANARWLRRDKDPRIFIMDILQTESKNISDEFYTRVDQVFGLEGDLQPPDGDLTAPYLDAKAKLKTLRSPAVRDALQHDLHLITVHVQEILYKSERIDTSWPIERRQDTLRAISLKFASKPTPEEMETGMSANEIAILRASYVYFADCTRCATSSSPDKTGWSRFPFNVAMRQLREIKAKAVGRTSTATAGFYERFKVDGYGKKK